MRIIQRIHRSAVGIEPNRTVQEAASIMNIAGVGALAVIEGDGIVGLVTDRDLVRRVMATGMRMDARVDAVMTTDVVTIDADADVSSAFDIFRTHAIRRLPVVRDGSFIGMITIDDLLIDVADQLAALAKPVTAELLFGHHDGRTPVEV
jgi:CBS domain-containing protein